MTIACDILPPAVFVIAVFCFPLGALVATIYFHVRYRRALRWQRQIDTQLFMDNRKDGQ